MVAELHESNQQLCCLNPIMQEMTIAEVQVEAWVIVHLD